MSEITDRMEYASSAAFSEILADFRDQAARRTRSSGTRYKKMVQRQRRIQAWAAAEGNLSHEQYNRFFEALKKRRYATAHAVLMEAFWTDQCITLWQRRRWDNWLKSTKNGFDHGLIG